MMWVTNGVVAPAKNEERDLLHDCGRRCFCLLHKEGGIEETGWWLLDVELLWHCMHDVYVDIWLCVRLFAQYTLHITHKKIVVVCAPALYRYR